MNCERFDLEELEVEPYQVKEVLRCLLHTIFFHRALGVVRPKDVDSDFFDLTYVKANDRSFEKLVEERLEQFCKALEKLQLNKGQLQIGFYERRVKQVWFSKQQEKIFWEVWTITLAVNRDGGNKSDSQERHRRKAALELALNDRLLEVVRLVNEKKDHIPPVENAEVSSFPYEISLPMSQDGQWGLDMLKKILVTSPTPSLK